jgi:hypothetical protein
MIVIEKIATDFVAQESNPGIIDIFLGPSCDTYNMGWFYKNIKNMCSESFISQTHAKGIAVGKLFGINGISCERLLASSTDYEHVVFEISDRDFIKLPKHYAKSLLKTCNVMIYDYIEGGSFLGTNLIQTINAFGIKPKNLYLHTTGYNFKETDIPNCTVLPNANLFALIVAQSVDERYLNSEEAGVLFHSILDSRDSNKFKYHAFLPVRKPRESRIKMIADLHAKKVLDDCLWSMAWSKKDGYLKYEFNNTPNIKTHQDTAKKNTDKNIKKFIKAYEKKLPRSLPDLPTRFEDFATNDWTWGRDVRWGVSLETFTLKEHPAYINPQGFLTEKTFRLLLNGITPLVLGAAGADTELSRIGFRIPDFGWDELSGGKRREAITDFIIKDHKAKVSHEQYRKDALHNMMLFRDTDFLVNLMLEGISKIEVQ